MAEYAQPRSIEPPALGSPGDFNAAGSSFSGTVSNDLSGLSVSPGGFPVTTSQALRLPSPAGEEPGLPGTHGLIPLPGMEEGSAASSPQSQTLGSPGAQEDFWGVDQQGPPVKKKPPDWVDLQTEVRGRKMF